MAFDVSFTKGSKIDLSIDYDSKNLVKVYDKNITEYTVDYFSTSVDDKGNVDHKIFENTFNPQGFFVGVPGSASNLGRSLGYNGALQWKTGNYDIYFPDNFVWLNFRIAIIYRVFSFDYKGSYQYANVFAWDYDNPLTNLKKNYPYIIGVKIGLFAWNGSKWFLCGQGQDGQSYKGYDAINNTGGLDYFNKLNINYNLMYSSKNTPNYYWAGYESAGIFVSPSYNESNFITNGYKITSNFNIKYDKSSHEVITEEREQPLDIVDPFLQVNGVPFMNIYGFENNINVDSSKHDTWAYTTFVNKRWAKSGSVDEWKLSGYALVYVSTDQDTEVFENYAVALTGFPLITSFSALRTDDLSNWRPPTDIPDNIKVPKLDKDGNFIGIGGKDDIKNNPNFGAKKFNEVTENQGKPTDDEGDGGKIEGDETNDNTPTLGTLGVFNRSYVMSSTLVNNLVDDLWNVDDNVFKAIVDGLALMGGNPIEAIIDLRLYPFDVSAYTSTSAATSIVMGRVKLPTAKGAPITSNGCAVLDLGSIKMNKTYGNFMDYEPFSKYKLYIPYCGGCDLPANLVVGHTIQVTMYVDLNTGSANAVIKIDNRNFKYINGTVGVSIPVTSNDAANYATSIIHAGANTINTAANTVGGTIGNALKGNVGGAITSGITGAVNTAVSAMDFSTKLNDVDIQMQGTASPSCSLYNPNYCYLLREYHAPIIPSNYGHCVGYECRVNGNLSSMSGYTVFADYDLSNCTGTDDEKKELSVLLRAGVYC